MGVPHPGALPQAYGGASAGEPRLPSPTEVKLHSSQQHAEQLQGTRPPLGGTCRSCCICSFHLQGAAVESLPCSCCPFSSTSTCMLGQYAQITAGRVESWHAGRQDTLACGAVPAVSLTCMGHAGADDSTRRAMEQRSLGHAMHTHLVEFLRSFLRTTALEVRGLLGFRVGLRPPKIL